jgi:methylated-DNA-[protein]-cysteine S-methyltransferase
MLSSLEMRFISGHMCAMPGAIATARMESLIGLITLRADDEALIGIRIGRTSATTSRHIATGHPVLGPALAQLLDWFAGNRLSFDIPLTPLGSAEGESLRAGIASIPYGETLTYGALAEQVGSVARAVGQACKTNPYPIIIPCHRVVSTAGPEYYSGGDGPRTKTWLLDFEYAHLPQDQRTRLI